MPVLDFRILIAPSVAFGISASTLLASPAFVDFADVQGSTSGNWNNIKSGTSLSNLVDSTGAPTSIDLALTFKAGSGFGGSAFNNGDSGAPAPFNALNAYGDGLYSNISASGAGIDLSFSGLAASTAYTIVFYGGRNDGNWSNADVTITTGTGTGGKVTHRSATTFTVTSDTAGTIVLNFVDDGSNAASGANATICAMSIDGPSDPLPTIESFTVNDHYVSPGTSVTFSWETSAATTVSIDQGIGDVTSLSTDGDGNTTANISTTTTYTLTATNAAGTATKTLRVGAGAPKPNILFFLVDDMGWQDTSVPFHHDSSGNPISGTYNTRYRTPNMETLAAQGRRFTNAYAYAVCSPTRVSIMTGMNSARHHVTTWTHPITPTRDTGQNNVPGITSPAAWRMEGMDATDIALPALLREAGYRTIHAGKAHFGVNGRFAGDPTAIGFDVNIAGHGAGGPGSYLGTQNFGSGMWQVPGLEAYHGQDIFLTEALTREMNQEIERAVGDGVPFFAYMSHYAVHVPWTNDNRFTANYPGLGGQELAFATVIEGMDKSLGDIIARLDQLGVAKDTFVVFYSDNGSDLRNGIEESVLRGFKGTCWEGGVRVPLIVGWAKIDAANPFQTQLTIPANSIEDDIVCAEDLFPSVAAIGGASYSHPIDGHDLTPYFEGVAGTHRPQRFLHHFPHGHGTDHFAILREGDWKLIYEYRATPVRRLFNLAADLGETNDLAASEPDRLMAMTRLLARELDHHGAQFSEFTPSGETIPPLTPDLPAVDLDDDGVPDIHEDPNRNGLQDPGETDPDNTNSDGDNINDGDEARIGTDPLDPSSRFAAVLSRPASGEVRLTWPSAPGATFTLRASPDLADWSELLATGVPAAPGATTSYDFAASAAPLKFFRVNLDP